MLSKKPMSFSEMLGILGVSSSFLTYHLENLGELIGKVDDGRYRLSSFGEAAIATMTKVEDIPTTAPQQSPEHPEAHSWKWSRPLGIIARRFKMRETEPGKTVGRSVAITLGIICILLTAGLGGAIAYHTMTINQLNATIAPKLVGINLVATDDSGTIVIPFNGTITSVCFDYTVVVPPNGVITSIRFNGTMTSIPFNYTVIVPPNGGMTSSLFNGTITSIPLNYIAVVPPSGITTSTRCLLVSGYVHNVGISTAYNCKIHVIAYQSGRVLAINTDIALGTISGQSQISVNASIPYDGSSLINWTLTPRWTASP
jgi:hypothetical protein